MPASIASRIDWDSLASVSTEFIVKQLDTVQADVLLKAKLDGRECFIYVLFEHQSGEDAIMAFRMLRYVVCIWSDFLKQNPKAKLLPPVLPCVLYHGPRPWKAATNCLDLIDLDDTGRAALGPLLPSMTFQLDDLRALTSEQIQQRMTSAFVGLTLLALRNLQAGDEDTVAEFFRLGALLQEVAEAESGSDALATILCYLLTVADPDTEQIRDFLNHRVGSKGDGGFRDGCRTTHQRSR